ncbi:Thioredoxin reductase [Vanrija pseudolonga]|uniref:Thioredoxin reductase n=1 Tax=Vanrija pseudolonga TaxID=143232 RepID=A0AAF1BKN1_9TREE|nr:Thioredoxin reductase [Vanrija pseudolonga]
MDVTALTSLVKELNDANAAGKTEDVIGLLKKLKTDVQPTEELLRTSRVGVAVGKLRKHATPGVSSLAQEIVKLWKDAVDESKRKRKRDEESKEDEGGAAAGGDAVKRVKAEASAPASASGASTPGTPDGKEKAKSPPPLSTIDTTRTKPRTAKDDGVDKTLRSDKTEYASEEVRDRCVVMIYDALASDSNAQTKVLSERAIAIEREALKLMKFSTGNDYRGKMRSLFLNLKDKGNPGLRNEIVLGAVSADKVVRMTKEVRGTEMASESVRLKNEKIAEHNLFKAKAVGVTQAETDAFKCSRCNQRKCTYYQMQTRSADEPMTVSTTSTGDQLRKNPALKMAPLPVPSIRVPAKSGVKSAKKHSQAVIIGSGPAGHTAAIYLARANLTPVLYEGMLANGFAPGGQLTTTTDVENFPGFPEGVTGPEMMDKFRAQSERFGTEIITETIAKVDLSSRPFKYWTEGEEEEADFLTADTIIIATGASAKRLFLPGEDTYWQSGISACAVCDGAVPIFRNKALAVIGGGDSAAEEAMYLTKYGSHVYVLVRRGELRASKIMAKRLLAHPKVTVLWHTVATECLGDGELLQSLKLQNVQTGESSELPVNGLFYAIGHEPATALIKGQVATDEDGYIITVPGTAQTSVAGVFAAGDVQDKRYRQAITSAGSGCMAGLEAERLLAEEEEDADVVAAEKKAAANGNGH